MARASVRAVCGLLAGLAMVAVTPEGASAATAAQVGCVVSIRYEAPVGPSPAGSSDPWSLPLLRGQPDPDHLWRKCPDVAADPHLKQPLWNGPAWGIPSLGSFV
ncbi:hypothetical protein [Flindersiella endophytica]